jgi:hypothetical protein
MSGGGWKGVRETLKMRERAPHPLPLPFLLLPDGSLICPWPRRQVLLSWQQAQIDEVRACLALVPQREFPRYAWCSRERVVPINPTPEQSWLDRRIFDGMRVSARVAELAAA